MTTQELATRLVELCRSGNFEAAQEELFSQDAASIEPHATPAFPKEIHGLDAMRQKATTWNEMVTETHGLPYQTPS